MKRIWNRRQEADPELSLMKSALEDAQQDLVWAYRRFNEAVDPEMVESCCYEINAAKARCDYLLRRIKELSRPVAACGQEDTKWI